MPISCAHKHQEIHTVHCRHFKWLPLRWFIGVFSIIALPLHFPPKPTIYGNPCNACVTFSVLPSPETGTYPTHIMLPSSRIFIPPTLPFPSKSFILSCRTLAMFLFRRIRRLRAVSMDRSCWICGFLGIGWRRLGWSRQKIFKLGEEPN